jgi:hypothetical protein
MGMYEFRPSDLGRRPTNVLRALPDALRRLLAGLDDAPRDDLVDDLLATLRELHDAPGMATENRISLAAAAAVLSGPAVDVTEFVSGVDPFSLPAPALVALLAGPDTRDLVRERWRRSAPDLPQTAEIAAELVRAGQVDATELDRLVTRGLAIVGDAQPAADPVSDPAGPADPVSDQAGQADPAADASLLTKHVPVALLLGRRAWHSLAEAQPVSAVIVPLRQRLSAVHERPLPPVRCMAELDLPEDEFRLYLRGWYAGSGSLAGAAQESAIQTLYDLLHANSEHWDGDSPHPAALTGE